jgi:hypothetical protein
MIAFYAIFFPWMFSTFYWEDHGILIQELYMMGEESEKK